MGPHGRRDRGRTGVVVLRFLGRSSVPGVAAGRRIVAEGTPRCDGALLVMLNPLYSFASFVADG
jgi:hypothetical protein